MEKAEIYISSLQVYFAFSKTTSRLFALANISQANSKTSGADKTNCQRHRVWVNEEVTCYHCQCRDCNSGEAVSCSLYVCSFPKICHSHEVAESVVPKEDSVVLKRG